MTGSWARTLRSNPKANARATDRNTCHEHHGRVALPHSRFSVDAAAQQRRSTIDGFNGRVHGDRAKGASHEPDGRASLSQASRIGSVPRASSGSPGRTRPTGFVGGQHVWKEQSDASGASVALTSNFRLRNGRYIFGLRSWRSTAAYSLQLMAQLRPTFLVG
ncbi:MAG: hypothetical protein FJ398_15305 [Verrucomicrobia bacterium]|nr:hypothetical protein [Verrucomicrobiota bacterium]